MRIGNDWVSYERNFGVLGLALAARAAFKDRADHQGISAAPDDTTRAAFELGQMFEYLPMVEGVNALSQAESDPQRFGQQFVSNVAEGFVPFSAGLRDAARLQDPTARDAQGVYARIVSGLPFAQAALPARVDPLGRTETNRSAAGVANALLPSPVSSAALLGTADAELARLGVYPGPSTAEVISGNRRVKLSPAQAQQRQQSVGDAMRRAAQTIVTSPGYTAMTDQARRDLLERYLARARRTAEKQFADRLRVSVRQPHAQ